MTNAKRSSITPLTHRQSRYWALQTPIIVVVIFCVNYLVDIVKTAMISSLRLQTNLLIYCTYCIYLFINLFLHLILGKHFYRFILTLNTFEDVIQPLAVVMYMIRCLLHVPHAFKVSAAQFMTLIQRLVSTISSVRAQYQLFEHNINIFWFACNMLST